MIFDLSDFLTGKQKLAVIGLGYVGLPLLSLFAKKNYHVVGYDTSSSRIAALKLGNDEITGISKSILSGNNIEFTDSPELLSEASIIIVTVPTPINPNFQPDLNPLQNASTIIGKYLKAGTVIVYESTVYPGLTEEICVPILEKHSNLKCGVGFKVGYSPERISPGETDRPLESIEKIVSAQDEETLTLLYDLYGSIINAPIHKSPSIKVAEASKIVENIQRDVNIALVNELALLFKNLDISIYEVLNMAGTKWNFHRYEPGLVGGHCISVDPYYLTHKAETIGFLPVVINSGRRVNNSMGSYIAGEAIKYLTNTGQEVKGAKILIMGFTYKENINDTRNTRVIDIYNRLQDFGANPIIYDPHVNPNEAKSKFGIDLLTNLHEAKGCSGIIVTVKHTEFKTANINQLFSLCNGSPILMDIKRIFDPKEVTKTGFYHWTF